VDIIGNIEGSMTSLLLGQYIHVHWHGCDGS
jgi:hypothetical protein